MQLPYFAFFFGKVFINETEVAFSLVKINFVIRLMEP